MANAETRRPLSKRVLFFFGLSEMPLSIAALPLLTFIPNYYIQDLGLSAALVGTALLVARLSDVVTDPLVGYLSDHTRSRFGRRRIWMVAGVPISMLSAYALFFPGPDPGIWWFSLSATMLWLGWTMIFVPYYAWASELSTDYNERSLITGWRTALGLVATASAQAIPTVALIYYGFGGTPAVVTMIGVMLLLLLPTTIGLTAAYTPETNKFLPTRVSIRQGLRLMLRNGPFKRLLSAFFVTHIGVAISATLFIFYVRGVLGAESAGIGILLVNYVANLAGIPFWIWVSKKIGKHRAWCMSMFLFVCANPFYFLLDVGDVLWMIPIIAVTGFTLGASATLGNSMKADVIDLDTLMSGENRAGLFFATWSMALKLALAVGPAIVLWILAGAGLEAAPGLIEDPQQRRYLQWLFILSSPLCNGIAALMVWRYPITAARHQRLRVALERRNARRLAQSS